jgi:hypothetical protein
VVGPGRRLGALERVVDLLRYAQVSDRSFARLERVVHFLRYAQV